MGLTSQRDKTVGHPSFIFDIQASDHQLGSLRIDNATSGGGGTQSRLLGFLLLTPRLCQSCILLGFLSLELFQDQRDPATGAFLHPSLRHRRLAGMVVQLINKTREGLPDGQQS